MHPNDRFKYLLDQYVSGHLTAQEHDELFELITTNQFDDLLGKHMLHDLVAGDQVQNADLPPHIAQDIIRNIYQAEKNTIQILPVIKHRSFGWKWMAAASVILILVFASYFIATNRPANENSLAGMIPKNMVIQQNETASSQKITLEDGSVITLAPQSAIHFPENFTGESREVFLEGEAFFEVAKNPDMPFLVYYNDVVTKVLGTSFTINTNQQTGNIEVSVRTGKVQVYENRDKQKGNSPDIAVILTPNQKAIYKKDNHLFETTLVDHPAPVLTEMIPGKSNEINAYNFIYQQEKLEHVFKQVEDVYGIEIVTENTAINNCLFTGDVSTNDLFTKLNIICLTVNATYEINGTKILIKGKGCK